MILMPDFLYASRKFKLVLIPQAFQASSPRHGRPPRMVEVRQASRSLRRLPGSRLHGCNLNDYFGAESHPCDLDTGNPCRYDELFPNLMAFVPWWVMLLKAAYSQY
jgi:hypothetical protein